MATASKPIHQVVNLIDSDSQRVLNTDIEQVEQFLLQGDCEALAAVTGSFALLARRDQTVRMARSLDRPMRYFLAKAVEGPVLVVADRIDRIRQHLEGIGFGDQFHPSYTRMVPAHHITTIELVGCPDPNPIYRRFVEPASDPMPPDLDLIGKRYVEALYDSLNSWLDRVPNQEPIGVLFSGGVDSGSVLLCLQRVLLDRGESAARLKAFTLSVDGGGDDAVNAREFLRRVELEYLGETIEVESSRIDPFEAVGVIEDYKPRDVECASVNLALLEAIRERYPGWRFLVDGDGGDENLKDYPIEENPELTIRSVVSNPLLYQEGWGVDRIKHSLTYSGGQSRGCVRTFAPLEKYGFEGFSPFTQPELVRIGTAIPFDELTQGSHQSLYKLKGEVMGRGLELVLGLELPIFDKRRFQEGSTPAAVFEHRFGSDPDSYRDYYLDSQRT
jgi:asparagine synthase (glutamine-hydrolysing)